MKSGPSARLLGFAAILLLAATVSLARPGGGGSYSGSSSSSGGGGSGGGSSGGDGITFAFEILELIRDALGWGVVPFYGLVFGVGFGIHKMRESAQPKPVDIGGRAPAPAAPPAVQDRDDMLKRLRESDPDFSMVLFEDFATTLYIESQRARHDPRALKGLAPYWAPAPLDALAERDPRGTLVEAVVVGSLRPVSLSEEGTRFSIECSFETNLHLRSAEGALTHYVSESWTFSRERSAKTKAWTGVRKLGCPNCGAPLAEGGDLRCPSCGEISGDGRFDWQVTKVAVATIEARPHSFTGNAEEEGTYGQTLFETFLRQKLENLFKADPGLSAKSIEARLRFIFDTMQPAWSAQDLGPLRPLVSDRQYDALRYWIDAYKEQGLRNLMENPHLTKFVFVRVERDLHYDAITLRIWATGLDITLDRSGKVVGGSRTTARDYSEYWTLIRSASARGTPRLDRNCPGCGVSLSLNMAGRCEHCGAHVTSGEFDWVLSKIEQDEAYRG
jgi:hypothetical protein